jgi:hypothetical protein
MVLYTDRADYGADTVFWCGHREFTEDDKSDVGPDDHVVYMAVGAVLVGCSDCWLTLASLLLPGGIYVPGGDAAVTFWCGHRDWIDGVGQPVAGDRTITVKRDTDVFLVACPDCAETFAYAIAEKAIRKHFEDPETLHELVEN